jgi:hypothetical protein
MFASCAIQISNKPRAFLQELSQTMWWPQLFGVVVSRRSLSSLSLNCDVSYLWYLDAGQSVTVFPVRRGAFVSTDVHIGQKWDVFIGDAFARSFEDTDYGVWFGDFEGHVVITATQEMNFMLHIRFLPYEKGEKLVLVKSSDPPIRKSPDAKLSREFRTKVCIFIAWIILMCVAGAMWDIDYDDDEVEDDRIEISESDVASIPPVLTQPIRDRLPYSQQPVQYLYVMPPPYPPGMAIP